MPGRAWSYETGFHRQQSNTDDGERRCQWMDPLINEPISGNSGQKEWREATDDRSRLKRTSVPEQVGDGRGHQLNSGKQHQPLVDSGPPAKT